MTGSSLLADVAVSATSQDDFPDDHACCHLQLSFSIHLLFVSFVAIYTDIITLVNCFTCASLILFFFLGES